MLVVLFALTAFADIPPPPGYVESCTVEKMSTASTECVSCAGYHGGREPCEAFEAEGYTKSCKTRGASVWDEVMCRPKGGAAPTEEPAANEGGEAEGSEAAKAKPEEPAADKPAEGATEEKPAEAETTAPAADGSSSKCDSTGVGAITGLAWLLPALAVRRRRA
ncbi:MAG: hypothetical protein KC912_13670 [Proteobacteria bacterium]|nr:hypothetical protein [Pseudomonadota bacterium]